MLIGMADAELSKIAAAQLLHHVTRAAAMAAADDTRRCAPEAVLSWAILRDAGLVAPPGWADDDLPFEPSPLHGPGGAAARRAGIDLALQLCAHFTSEGRSEQAMFYQRLATVVDTEE